MITTKQRAYLRGLGAKLTPIFQIGKNGIEDNFLKQVDDALEAREILKINVLENSGLETREASNFICERLGCEGVQSIGNKIVLYRESKNNPKIELPKKGK
ncbi:ribosome assembly RNA-binding protein YhbY [Clostridium sp.]|uniref:ribosome assembly RNA-binding protein YhbY n=1 Tax=Clostridium sp. TaxID=1506 RepID=UPI00261732AF